jgi:2-phospho-L-lactate/phosphoenolpyruvate guanylyltransferase
MHSLHALIAVKDLARAKSRLADAFAPADRERLVLAMMRDSLAAARQVEPIVSLTVVTPDATVAESAQEFGADIYPEPAADSTDDGQRLNLALSHAAADLRERLGAVDLLALQADLPALRPRELTAAIAAAHDHSRSYIVDHRGTGTSALLLRDPTTALEPKFGAASALRHAETGAHPLAGDWPGLRLDVDTVEDLRLAAELGLGVATRELLNELGWPDPEPRESSS